MELIGLQVLKCTTLTEIVGILSRIWTHVEQGVVQLFYNLEQHKEEEEEIGYFTLSLILFFLNQVF